MFRRTRIVRLMIAFIFGSIGLVVPASVGAQSLNQHCVVEIFPLQAGETQSVTIDRGCYATEAESLAVAIGGKVRLSQDELDRLSPEQFRALIETVNTPGAENEIPDALPGQYLIGKVWDGVFKGGASLDIYTSNAGLCNGYSYGGNFEGWWNDKTSSLETYSGCSYMTVYELINQSSLGASTECLASCGSLGIMDNAASSYRIFDR